jgi:hypothetical protein
MVDDANGVESYTRLLQEIGGLPAPYAIVAAHGNKIFTTAGARLDILIMNSGLGIIGSINNVWDPSTERLDSMAFDDNNNVYVALGYKTRKGGLLEQFPAHSSHVSRKLSLGNVDCNGKPCPYAVDQNGFVYIISALNAAVLENAPGSHTPRKIRVRGTPIALAVSLPHSH